MPDHDSFKLESSFRGFSYHLNGPLDMRMFSRGDNPNVVVSSNRMAEQYMLSTDEEAHLLKNSITAYEVVNYFSEEQIADIIHQVCKHNACFYVETVVQIFA